MMITIDKSLKKLIPSKGLLLQCVCAFKKKANSVKNKKLHRIETNIHNHPSKVSINILK